MGYFGQGSGAAPAFDPRKEALVYSDFIAGTTGIPFSTSSVNGGAVVPAGIGAFACRAGFVQLRTGANAAGRAAILGNADAMWLRNAKSIVEADFEIPGAHLLGDHAQVMFGFFRNSLPASVERGAFLLYDLGTDLPEKDRWVAYAVSNSVAERLVTPVVVAPSTFYRLRVEVEARPGALAKADFFIDGVLVASLPTGIPLALTDTLTAGASIVKQGGTTNRFINLDYLYLRQQWAARGAA